MKKKKKYKILAVLLTLCIIMTVTGCGKKNTNTSDRQNELTKYASSSLPIIPESEWHYNEKDNVYWQVGIPYCEAPLNAAYETLAIFVPGHYMSALDNGDGTYVCKVNPVGPTGNFTGTTAPFVMPVNTPDYVAMAPLKDYTSAVAPFTNAGFIYVHAGCRGSENGEPVGVTDLKAAIRFIRYSAENIPGDLKRFFTFDISDSDAQNIILGASGDSILYDPYLSNIGAVMTESDAILGAMCWNPITSCGLADEAYDMYNPLYYIDETYNGYDYSTVAQYWRIDTENVTNDFITWVEECLA